MRKLFLFVLLSCSGILAQTAPTLLPMLMLNADTQAKLGAQISWNAVSGASAYDVYHYETGAGYGPCPTTGVPSSTWTQFATTTNTFAQDFPTPTKGGVDPKFGAGGIWCYGVSAVIGGVEGPIAAAPERMLLGQYLYVRVCLQTAPYVKCDSHHGLQSDGIKATVAITRTHNGVTEQMPVRLGFSQPENSYLSSSIFRQYSHDTIAATVTLPDGTALPIEIPTGPDANPSATRNYVRFLLLTVNKNTDTIVNRTDFSRFRIASPLE